jgi:prevent-host-death family protein
MDIKYINSSEARKNFFKVLDEVADGGTVVVKRAGKPVAKISGVEEKPKNDFRKYFGIFSDEEADRMKKLVETGRRDGSHKKKYLLKW